MLINAIIDISHWNESVNFKLVKEDGIVGIIHRATQGLKYVDPEYVKRRKAAEEEELLWGAYHFGDGEKSGKDQAEHFLEIIGDSSDILLALDIEENKGGKSITPKQAEDFVNKVYLVTGRLPLIYGNTYFLKDFATPTLTECPLWLARWEAEPTLPIGWRNWTLWQYTDGKSGKKPHSVEGVGPCDRNKFNGTLEKIFGYHDVTKIIQTIISQTKNQELSLGWSRLGKKSDILAGRVGKHKQFTFPEPWRTLLTAKAFLLKERTRRCCRAFTLPHLPCWTAITICLCSLITTFWHFFHVNWFHASELLVEALTVLLICFSMAAAT